MRLTYLSLVLVIAGMTGSLEAASPRDGSTHKVRKGETAATIARQHGLSLGQLSAINPGVNVAKLAVGQGLSISRKPHPEKASRVSKSMRTAKVAPEADLEPAARESAPVAGNLSSLPGTPGLGPTSLVHLERILPTSTKLANPPSETGSIQLDGASHSTSLLASQLQPVLPPVLDPLPSIASSLGFEPVDPSNIDLLWPVETRTVSSAWGPRVRTRMVKVKPKASQLNKRIRVRYKGTHKGIDLNAPLGTDIYAAMDGRVVDVRKAKGFGNLVILDHGNGVQTVYAHNKANFVHEGDLVRRGQKIAEVGRTGNASGCHVHFELRVNGQPRNPIAYLNDVEEIAEEMVASNTMVGRRTSRR